MTGPDSLDHEQLIQRACAPVRSAGERGGRQYGSLLVADGDVVGPAPLDGGTTVREED